MFGFKHFRKNVLGVWDKAMHENVCDRLEAATERGWQIRALDSVSMAILAFVQIMVEFDRLWLNALPNLLSFNLSADHFSLQRPLFREKNVGEIIAEIWYLHTKTADVWKTYTYTEKTTNHLQLLPHCCKTRTPMILTFTLYHSNFTQWENSCE